MVKGQFYPEKPVGYQVYIRKDWKRLTQGGRRVSWHRHRVTSRPRTRVALLAATLLSVSLLLLQSDGLFAHRSPVSTSSTQSNARPKHAVEPSTATVSDPVVPEETWSAVKVRTGDNLSAIFARTGLSAKSLDLIMQSGNETTMFSRIHPGHTIEYQVRDGQLIALRYSPSAWQTVEARRNGESFQTLLLNHEVETRFRKTEGVIADSLFQSGQKAGLNDALIMDLVSIYAWDVDFALEVRTGDAFRVLYHEHVRDGKIVGTGPILAAEFINQGRSYRSVRFTSSDGRSDYYSDDGVAMRKAFLRTPLKFTRISSTFSQGRKHPVLNLIRAHRGVDYAAPQGTPVKAAGDGTVVYLDNKGGYGRTIVLRHGSGYSTLYAHLSRYARELKRGSRVQQGAIIGYVGMTGLATGPHLHYEFQVAGVHRNPLTVDLPKAEPIQAVELTDFRQQTAPLLAELETTAPANGILVALGETPPDTPVVH
jgi:murein DD-endopeptidase MepM/ murein hydrolase activator NlpD